MLIIDTALKCIVAAVMVFVFLSWMYLVEICLTGKLMHHSTVLLRDGSLLLCGGRASPMKPSSSFFQLRLEGAMAVWSCINLDPTSDFPEPRWRHTATSILWSNGRLSILV